MPEKPIAIQSVEKPLDSAVIKIAKREALMWDTKQQEAIEKGNVLHELLAEISDLNAIEKVVQSAMIKGLLTIREKQEIELQLKEIVTHPELVEFFNPDFLIYTERPILNKKYKNIKPDRVAIDGKKAFIIDYKTGEEKKKHQQQINEYALALEEMGFEVIKKVLLYIQDDLKVIYL